MFNQQELNLECTNISIKKSLFCNQILPPDQPKKMNVGIFYNEDLDEHIKILLERCNQLNELHLKYYVPITDSAITNIIVEELKNSQYLDTLNLNLYSRGKISYSKLLQLPVMTKLTNFNIIRNKKITRLKIELQSLNLYINEEKEFQNTWTF